MTEETKPKPELERRSKRRFSATEKLRLLTEFNQLERGDKGAWLRRQGLYAGQVSLWSQAATKGAAGLEPQAPGRKPLSDLERQNRQLTAELLKLRERVRIAEGLLDLQKKLHSLLPAHSEEMPL
jgi:transposase